MVRWLLVVLAVTAGFVGVSRAVTTAAGLPIASTITQPGPLVVIGIPRLTWDDISARKTPEIWSLAQTGAVGALTTRAYGDHSCTSDAWLTVSAGFAASTFARADCSSAPMPDFKSVAVTRVATWTAWPSWRQLLVHMDPPAPIGMLADVMEAHGQCITATGNAALLGAATSAGDARVLIGRLSRASRRQCGIEFLSLTRIDDAAVAALIAQLPPHATTVLAGMGDANGPTSLHAVILNGPEVRQGMLTSRSTRQPGFLETTDLTAFVLSRLGGQAPTLQIGRTPTVMPSSPEHSIRVASDLTRTLNIEKPFVATFFGLFLGGSTLLLAIGALRWVWISRRARTDRTAHIRLRRWFAWSGAICACMPAATFLVGLFPWWRTSHPRAALCLGIALISLVISSAALLGPWRRLPAGPMTFVASATFVIIAQDVIHGSRMQLTAVMGLQPVFGGRYYGMGNVGAALWVTSALLAAAMFGNYLVRKGHPRLAATTIVLIGLTALLIDSVPWWGNKAGAMIAITPAFGYLALCATGLRLTWRRALGLAGITVILAAAFTIINTMVPLRDRTHIGNFGAEVAHGNFHGLWNIIRLNWAMLTSNWLNGSVLLIIVGIVVYFLRPSLIARPLDAVLDQLPLLGPGISAVMLSWLLAFLAEDSGTGIPPTGLLVLAPLLTLLAARIPATANPAPTSVETDGRQPTGIAS